MNQARTVRWKNRGTEANRGGLTRGKVNPAEMPEAPIGPLMNIQGEKAKRSFHFEAGVGSVQVLPFSAIVKRKST